MTRHQIEVRDGYKARDYWWVCTCGDEGGPYEMWEFAHDAALNHSVAGDE
jgi:hypothetical protein